MDPRLKKALKDQSLNKKPIEAAEADGCHRLEGLERRKVAEQGHWSRVQPRHRPDYSQNKSARANESWDFNDPVENGISNRCSSLYERSLATEQQAQEGHLSATASLSARCGMELILQHTCGFEQQVGLVSANWQQPTFLFTMRPARHEGWVHHQSHFPSHSRKNNTARRYRVSSATGACGLKPGFFSTLSDVWTK
eukprot:6484985-Amphidinium_carterae.2